MHNKKNKNIVTGINILKVSKSIVKVYLKTFTARQKYKSIKVYLSKNNSQVSSSIIYYYTFILITKFNKKIGKNGLQYAFFENSKSIKRAILLHTFTILLGFDKVVHLLRLFPFSTTDLTLCSTQSLKNSPLFNFYQSREGFTARQGKFITSASLVTSLRGILGRRQDREATTLPPYDIYGVSATEFLVRIGQRT